MQVSWSQFTLATEPNLTHHILLSLVIRACITSSHSMEREGGSEEVRPCGNEGGVLERREGCWRGGRGVGEEEGWGEGRVHVKKIYTEVPQRERERERERQ